MIRLTKRRGQNFLKDASVVNEVVRAAGLSKRDIVLEVGPGMGALTIPLARSAKRVIAIELDLLIIDFLKKRLREESIKNVEVVHADILNINPKIFPQNFILVSNLPFNISSDFLRIFLTNPNYPRPKRLVLILQYELAKRITAKAGEMSLLSVLVQAASQARILSKIKRGSFGPAPKVDAALIKIEPALASGLFENNLEPFIKFVKKCFAARRKKLANNLAKGGYGQKDIKAALTHLKLDDRIRPQDLSVEQWIKLFYKLS